MSSPAADRGALSAAVEAAAARFTARNPRSAALHAEAQRSMPGGNTRTTLHTAPFPVYMRRGEGFRVTSEDGHVYTDLVGEFSAGLYGHSHPVVLDAIGECVRTAGLGLGAQTAHEVRFATAVCERFGLERVRFANSGTEANLHALAAARAFTGKRKVVVFGGGYHGGLLGFAGGKPAKNNVDLADWVVVDGGYNNLEKAAEAIGGEGVAAVLVEGLQGSAGAIPGKPSFMRAVQDAAKEVRRLSSVGYLAVRMKGMAWPCCALTRQLGWRTLHPGRSDDLTTDTRRHRCPVPTHARLEDDGKVARRLPGLRSIRRESRCDGCL